MLQLAGAVTKDYLDAIARRLYAAERELGAAPWLNPNKSALGLGNYSVGVLETAFREHGLDCTQRVSACSASSVVSDALPVAELDELEGLVVNRAGSLFGVIKTRHWYAVRRLPETCAKASPVTTKVAEGVAARTAAGSIEAQGGDWFSLDSLQQQPRRIGGAPELYALLQQELDSGGDVFRVYRAPVKEIEATTCKARAASSSSSSSSSSSNCQVGSVRVKE